MSTKAIIHGALNGPAGSDLTYFFHGDQFVVYDWAADQVTLGLKSVTDDWVSAGPVGFAMQCDAGLSCHDVGQPAYAQKHYLFDGDYYVRYDWNAGTPRVAESTGNPSAWHLPAEFATGIDAAVNGKFSRAGKTYFLKGSRYARYDWNSDSIEYVKSISEMAPGMFPASFTSDIDAIVHGVGAFNDYSYFFKGDLYLKFDWDNGGNTPFVDGSPRSITAWPGLWDMLLACSAKSKAFEWIWAALPRLRAHVAACEAGLMVAVDGDLAVALQAHFRLSPAQVVEAATLRPILANLEAIEAYLHRAPEVIRFATLAKCEADRWARRELDNTLTPTTAAYTTYQLGTFITPLFHTRGEACRAAQLIHEGGHFVDAFPNIAHDIPEWYVTQPVADALGLVFQNRIPGKVSRYDEMTPEVARHNPSSYAAFCQQMRYNVDTRYGELRQEPLPGIAF